MHMFHSLQCTMVNSFVAGILVLFRFIEIMETTCEKAFKRAFKSNSEKLEASSFDNIK